MDHQKNGFGKEKTFHLQQGMPDQNKACQRKAWQNKIMESFMLLTLLIGCMMLSACGGVQSETGVMPEANTEAGLITMIPAETAEPGTDSHQTVSAESEGLAQADPTDDAADNSAFFALVKNYLLTGQDTLPQAGQLLWSPAFLDAVEFQPVYEAFLSAGGNQDDVLAFATYLTENAPAPDNWKTLFESDLMASYEQQATRYEDLGDGIYQIYVNIDGKEVPFVTVNSHTGWFHG